MRMKKCIRILLFLLVLAIPIPCLAAPAPLTKVSSSAKVSEEIPVQAVSYKAYITADADTNLTNSTIVLKNTGDESVYILMGIPLYIKENSIKLSNIEVIMDGKKQRLADRRDKTDKEAVSFSDLPYRWYSWYVSIEPGAYKVIGISYTTQNIKAEDGTKSIFIPLEFINAWSGTPQNVEVTLDLGDAPPYVLEPNPSVLPHEYDRKGRLSWSFSNEEVPANIQVYFRPTEALALEYISANAAGDRSVASIIKAFESKSYYDAIEQIDAYFESSSDPALKNELMYLQALAYEALYQKNTATEIFNKLESQPLFGQLEGTFKNRIIYDKYYQMKSLLTENTTLYSYLDSTKDYVMGNALFVMWIEDELSYLQSLVAPEPEPTPTPEQPADDNINTDEKDTEKELVKSITIGDYEISVEMLFLAAIALVIIIALIIRKRRRHRHRGYLFRY